MKNSFESFFDFITGEFFNIIGVASPVLFLKRNIWLEEPLSNDIAMGFTSFFLLAFSIYIKITFL